MELRKVEPPLQVQAAPADRAGIAAGCEEQLAGTQSQREAIARQIAELEASGGPALREAEAVARVAADRTDSRS